MIWCLVIVQCNRFYEIFGHVEFVLDFLKLLRLLLKVTNVTTEHKHGLKWAKIAL